MHAPIVQTQIHDRGGALMTIKFRDLAALQDCTRQYEDASRALEKYAKMVGVSFYYVGHQTTDVRGNGPIIEKMRKLMMDVALKEAMDALAAAEKLGVEVLAAREDLIHRRDALVAEIVAGQDAKLVQSAAVPGRE
jgi:hypothetical protein